MRIVTAFALALIAAGPALAAPIAVNPFNDRMRQLRVADQNGALRRAITLDNQRCGRLSDGRYCGMYGNLGFWQARCTPGGDYAVFVGPDGEVQVRGCADMAGLKLPACVLPARRR